MVTSSNLSKELNPAQIQAVEAIEGPVLVIAGPGSGKTRVIVQHIAYLLQQCGVKPHRVMAVTFTNKAAKEMKDRIQRILSQPLGGLLLGTFHAIGARILRTEADAAGLDPNFVIYDASDQNSLVKRAMHERDIDSKKFGTGPIRSRISAAKAHLQRPSEMAGSVGNYFDEVALRVYERYEELLRQSNALDFDDLIMRPVRLLEANPDVLERYQDRFVHVLIDEFQDTNAAQYRLARLMSDKYRNLFAVGDPDQSIYSWRHAEIGNIMNFERVFPGARVVKLEQNYRSTQTILEASGKVIAHNRERKEKELWTENPLGAPITVGDALNEQDEAAYVVSEVDRLAREAGHRHGDCAVMYRTNAQSRPLEEAFVRYGLPYHLVGATRFYERREVKDVLAYIRLVHNPFDDVSLQRIVNVPARGIGQRTVDELARWGADQGLPIYSALQLLSQPEESPTPLPELNPRAVRSLQGFRKLIDDLAEESAQAGVGRLINAVLDQTGYRDYLLASDDNGEERLENVLELRTVAEEFNVQQPEEGLAAFLEQVALVADTDNMGERPNSVTLITLHQAKGLEFPVVFIVGMEEGVLPHVRSFEDEAQMEEERRLCYVGMTRARERLYLLRAYRRSAMGMRSANPPSRFLADLPSHLTKKMRHGPQRTAVPIPSPMRAPAPRHLLTPAPEPQPSKPAAVEYRAGDRVRHGTFGEGVVVSCVPSRDDQQITVSFKGAVGIKRLLLSYAPLERL
ncbi:MAG: UvrD-helicase domain-containing protein, partial [Chloroflexi bacterium]|nr:UvrD-helicase domain-containing protein [Chloroflexota bacterium]